MSSERKRAPARKFLKATLAGALVAALPGGAGAARIDYNVGLAVLRSDNIGLADTGEISETVVSPRLNFTAEQQGSTFRLNMLGSVQYLDYLDDSYDDGFRGAFSGQARWTMIPERLEFTFEDYLSRQPVDTLSAFSPGNEQQTNVFVTGPSLFVRLGSATRGQLDLRYINSYAEDSEDFDSDRYSAALRTLHELSDNRRLTANVEATKTDFDLGTPDADYTRYDGYVGYSSTLRSLDLVVEAGYSRLEPEDGSGTESAPLLRGSVDWRISPRSSLTADFGYQFADAAQDLTLQLIDPEAEIIEGFGSPGVPVRPQVFRERSASLGYKFASERVQVQLQPYYQRINYVDPLISDQTIHGGYFEVGYQLRPRLALTLMLAQTNRDYDDPDREDRDFTAGISLVNEFTRHWSGRIDLRRSQRNSSVSGQDYDENAATISVSYRR